MHTGISSPLAEDAISESRAAAQGGVTSSLNYFRTGQYYLNKGGPYREFFPEVLELSGGRAHIDHAFHVAPMSKEHIGELDDLVMQHGVTSFKIFMFYGSHGLHGRSEDQSKFLMTPPGERYDYAHFEFVMRGIQAVREAHPELADRISLSLHCETAEIMAAYTKLVEEGGEQIRVELSAAKIRVTFDSVILTSKLIDGTFPDYSRVIPTANDKLLKVDPKLFFSGVDRVATIATEKTRAVKIGLDHDRVTLSVTSPDNGTAAEELAADYKAEGMEIGFNANYLKDILGQIDAETVELHLADAGAPTLIRENEASPALYVLMPMRV
jgi:hypothetical protein